MRALVFDKTLHFDANYPDPDPPEGHVLIQVTKAGICNTDLELTKGYMGFSGILGHEFAGVVERGPDDWRGKRVAGEINLACRVCDVCRGGAPSQCPQRVTLGINGHDGVFADYATLPVANLYALPDSVSDDMGVFVEPLAAALQVTQRRAIASGEKVAVIGDGKLGLLTAQVVALTGCDLTLVGRHPAKLALAAGWGIATAGEGELLPDSCDVVVDCTGQADGFAAALDIVRPRGDIVLKSTYHGLPQADLTRVVVDEVSVIGSRCGPFAPAIDLLADGKVDVDSLVVARYGLDDGVSAMAHAAQRSTLKVLLDIS